MADTLKSTSSPWAVVQLATQLYKRFP